VAGDHGQDDGYRRAVCPRRSGTSSKRNSTAVASQSSVPGGATLGGHPGGRYTSAMVKDDSSPLSLLRSNMYGK
jgi:hypothetical protein